jgi:GNAT superfamily N-acetyltransferase
VSPSDSAKPDRPANPLFAADPCVAVELAAGDIPELQRFFEANPDYYEMVYGRPPTPEQAHDEILGALPAGWPYTKKWVIALRDDTGVMSGMANIVSDLLAPGVWHLATFMVADRLHGTGLAQTLYAALEQWTRDSGAQWLRLGVVEGNARAERFWERNGYVEVRRHQSVEMGLRVNVLRVMAKPLAGGALADYYALVKRDRAEP